MNNKFSIEEGLTQTRQLRLDHRQLVSDVEAMLRVPNVTAIPLTVKRLVLAGVDPVVVAKHLLIGDRAGTALYTLSARAALLAAHEAVTNEALALAWQMVEPTAAAHMAAGGAAWLATQFGVSRDMLAELCATASRRLCPVDNRRGYGAVDMVDHHGAGTRESLIAVLRQATLPVHAVLEYSGPR